MSENIPHIFIYWHEATQQHKYTAESMKFLCLLKKKQLQHHSLVNTVTELPPMHSAVISYARTDGVSDHPIYALICPIYTQTAGCSNTHSTTLLPDARKKNEELHGRINTTAFLQVKI